MAFKKIEGMAILATALVLCSQCKKEWDKLLIGENEEFIPCNTCNEALKSLWSNSKGELI